MLTSAKKVETAVHCCDPALSALVMFGVSKRLSRNVSVVIYCLYIFLADQISCISYVGSVYRMRSIAVSGFPFNKCLIMTSANSTRCC